MTRELSFAYAGDIIGLYDGGSINQGMPLLHQNKKLNLKALPSFTQKYLLKFP